MKILVRTVKQVFLAEGIAQADHATVEAFDDYLARTAKPVEHLNGERQAVKFQGWVE